MQQVAAFASPAASAAEHALELLFHILKRLRRLNAISWNDCVQESQADRRLRQRCARAEHVCAEL